MRVDFLKRLFDLSVVVPSIIILSPLMMFISAIVFFRLGHPVIFKQVRPGFRGKTFTIYKFRTLTNECDSAGCLLPDSKRQTGFGKWLRRMSLDEVPELFNVLRGDMSLVGPRPLLLQYLGRYTPEHARRHEVKPGITGWAQINGRNSARFSKRLAMDVWYVDNRSFRLDLKIMLLSIVKVVRGEGVGTAFEQGIAEIDDCGLSDDLTK